MFDVNAAIGRDAGGSPLAVADADGLCSVMDRYGLSGALVYHMAARQSHPADGNRLLAEAVRGWERLAPCWVGLPDGHEDGRGPAGFVEQLRAAGVRAVRLFPVRFHFPIAAAVLGPLLEQIERARVPVLVDWEAEHWSRQLVDWTALSDLAGRFPRLPIVLVGMTIGQVRAMMPVLAARPSLHVETSNWQLPDGPAWLAQRIGAGRVLLGTGLPFAESAMPINALARSSLNAADREAAARGNAARLLGWSPPRASGAAARAALPVFDAHVHFGKWASTFTLDDDADGMVRQMDRCGVERAALISLLACVGEDDLGNGQVAEAISRHPDRFVGYATVSPHRPDADAALAHWLDDCGFRGVKIHTSMHSCAFTSDLYRPHWEAADARGLPLLVHGGADWATMDAMLDRHPRAQFLHAHAGAVWRPGSQEVLHFAAAHPNYYADLAGSAHQRGALQALVEAVGPERVVYGSDAPLFDFAYQVGRVVGADLSEAHKRLVLYGNAARLFGVGGA